MLVQNMKVHSPTISDAGGSTGPPGCNRRDGEMLPGKATVSLERGQSVEIRVCGGGGMFDPRSRPESAVLEDVADGVVSNEGAARDDGVALAADGRVDRAATDDRRGCGFLEGSCKEGRHRRPHSPPAASRICESRSKLSLLALLLPLLLAASLSGPVAAELEVTLEQVASDDGNVLVAVCTRETFLRRGCPYTGRAPAVSGEAEVVVRNIEPGVYAVQAFHDENGNLDLDRNFLGMPQEGMGFSNDARMRFGPPSFEDAAIEIGEGGAAIRLRLRYFD